jgi:serine/threonine-protein kinase
MKDLLELGRMAALFVTVAVVSAVIVMKVAMYTGGEGIQTPSVTGATIITALETLERQGLYLKVTKLEYHQEAPKDRIISQAPAAGEPIKRGRDVKVVVSKGAKSQIMPNLAGVTQRGLERLLAQSELRVKKVVRVHMSGAEKGVILAQTPAAGAAIGKGEEVTLVESLGPPPKYLAAPDLADKPLDGAMKALADVDLKISEVTYRQEGGKAKGITLAQDPPFGRRVEKGSAVALVASEGVEDRGGASASYTIFFYTIPPGPDPVKVSIVQGNAGGEKEVYNRVHMPGDTVSLLIEVRGKSAAKVFLNDKLADVKRF